MTLNHSQDMSISALKSAYSKGELEPSDLIAKIREQALKYESHNIWIHFLNEEELKPYLDNLKEHKPDNLPLWGVPFAIKDNIDLAGIPTTAGCEAFSYIPNKSAQVVQNLLDAGAIPLGKTNLDQFATGLNGTRSPWGACANSFNAEYISGGSSSGSAVALALGMTSFSLGTDTAGSGRVPACFNNLIGLKPSRGLLSTRGLVPACRSLDCISIFAYNTDDANKVLGITEGYDARDAFSRTNPYSNQSRQYGLSNGALHVGVLPEKDLEFFGDESYEKAYKQTLQALKNDGFECIELDYSPFAEAAKLLYEGPWVSERYIATQPLIEDDPDAVFPVVQDIISQGCFPSAVDLFTAEYKLEALKKESQQQLDKVDCMLLPTVGRHYTIAEMQADPIRNNSRLGHYTNFVNLLDLAAIAVPTVMTDYEMPFGITLVGPSLSDRYLLSIANRIQQAQGLPMGALKHPVKYLSQLKIVDTKYIDVLVCGAHLEGLPLNWQLVERGGVLKEKTRTAEGYRMYALAGGPPFRPGLIRDNSCNSSIEVEIWTIPATEFGSFVSGIPAPLGIGKVVLKNGDSVSGFICEPYGIEDAEEITHFGGWKAYMKHKAA